MVTAAIHELVAQLDSCHDILQVLLGTSWSLVPPLDPMQLISAPDIRKQKIGLQGQDSRLMAAGTARTVPCMPARGQPGGRVWFS